MRRVTKNAGGLFIVSAMMIAFSGCGTDVSTEKVEQPSSVAESITEETTETITEATTEATTEKLTEEEKEEKDTDKEDIEEEDDSEDKEITKKKSSDKSSDQDYQYIGFGYDSDSNGDAVYEVSLGDMQLDIFDGHLQVKNGSDGEYKATPIPVDNHRTFALNENNILFIDKSEGTYVLNKYNFASGEVSKLADLPESDSTYDNKVECCDIIAVYGDYVYFSSYNGDLSSEGSVMYSYNVNDQNILRAGISNYGDCSTYGKYILVADKWRTGVNRAGYDLYEFTDNGNIDLVEHVSGGAYSARIYDDYIYWVEPVDVDGASRLAIYTMTLSGNDKRTLYTSTEQVSIELIESIDSEGIVFYGGKTRFNFSTGQLESL